VPSPRFARFAGAAWLVCAAAFFATSAARADYIDHFATRTDVGLYKIPSKGPTRVLVVPVFIDNIDYPEGSEEAFLEEITAFYADDDATIFEGGFRFTGYWEQASLGRYRPSAEVAAPVHFPSCPPLGAHEDCEIPRGAGLAEGDIQGAVAVLTDALRFMDEIFRCASEGPGGDKSCTAGGGVDFARYDTSGNQQGVADGFVDGVVIVSNAGFPGIALPVRDLASQPLLSFLGPFPTFTYPDDSGVVVASVGIAGRTSRPGRETFVSVHEFGHLLGFCDLYNEAGTTSDLPYTLMGGWFYQDAGSLLDPFSRLAIGWGNMVQVSGAGSFTLPSAARSGQVLKVGDGDEFFLVEHRRKLVDVLDGDMEVDSGVLVQRVRLSKRPSSDSGAYFNTLQSCVNCTPFDTMLMVEEADGNYDLQLNQGRDDDGDLFQSGDTIGPSSDTAARGENHVVFSTNLLSGAQTGLTITVTSSDDEGAVVDVDAPAVADVCDTAGDLCGTPCAADDDGHGRCGDFLAFPEEARSPGDPDPPGQGCTCAGSSDVDVGVIGLALLLLGPIARRRRRDTLQA
jgi:M6 family metalloprotease-like protein